MARVDLDIEFLILNKGIEISMWDICTFISVEAVQSHFGWLEDLISSYQNAINVKHKCWRLDGNSCCDYVVTLPVC